MARILEPSSVVVEEVRIELGSYARWRFTERSTPSQGRVRYITLLAINLISSNFTRNIATYCGGQRQQKAPEWLRSLHVNGDCSCHYSTSTCLLR